MTIPTYTLYPLKNLLRTHGGANRSVSTSAGNEQEGIYSEPKNRIENTNKEPMKQRFGTTYPFGLLVCQVDRCSIRWEL